jgi:2-amino-4-hydroxy-6-hydroxymethyldihydropteridine diphosphokinase
MSAALVALGSNLGNRQQQLDRAVRLLAQTPGIYSVHESKWRSTRAVGGMANQAEYLNGAVCLETALAPELLFSKLAEIETQLGRSRHERWSPRTIDLDLLLYDERVLRSPQLELPHPRMAFRRFVLDPAAEVAPNMLHPTSGMTVAELRANLDESPRYVAISGPNLELCRQLATAAGAKVDWNVLDLPGSTLAFDVQSPTGPGERPSIEFPDDFLPLLERNQWPTDVPGIVTPFWIGDFRTIEMDSKGKQFLQPRLLVIFDSERVERKHFGPSLHLNPNDPAGAEIELVAAIQAMS